MSDTTVAAATWGDFNSLIQLSIGLNAAFATFSDFLGNGLTREEHFISRTIKTIVRLPEASTDDAKDKRDLQFLLGRCASNRVQHEKLRSGFIRIFGFICAFIGTITLVYASNYANNLVGLYGQLIIYFLLTPFLLGAGHGMYISSIKSSAISVERRLIEGRFFNRQKRILSGKKESMTVLTKQEEETTSEIPTLATDVTKLRAD